MKYQEDVVVVFFTETWSRIAMARRLHKLNKLKYIASYVRCIPWPHVDAYNNFVTTFVTAKTSAELKAPILTTKEQIIRRLNYNTYIFNRFDHDYYVMEEYSKIKLTNAEKIAARKIIAQLLQVGPDGEPLADKAVPGFKAWELETLQF